MKFEYDDGGRSLYFKGIVGDCVTRALAIALNMDYKAIYDDIKSIVGYSPRNGIENKDVRRLMKNYGFEWHATMGIGTGCKTHLKDGEIPQNCICNLSGHVVCVKNNTIRDLADCSRGGKRCVYGYWTR